MKLQNEVQNVIQKMKEIEHKIAPYAEQLKQMGGYKDFETRLAYDVLKAVVSSKEICEWYEKYNCNDEHITTLAKRCLKEVYKVD